MENAQDNIIASKEVQMQATGEGNQHPINGLKKHKKKRSKKAAVSSEPSSSSAAYSMQETLLANSLIKESRGHDLEQQIKKQQNRIENLEKQVEERQNAIEIFGPMCASLERDFSELKKEYEEAKEQIISLEREKKVLSEELKTEKIYRTCTDEELAQKLKLAEERIRRLEKEKTKLGEDLNRYQRIINFKCPPDKVNEEEEKIIWSEINEKILKLKNLQKENSELYSQIGQLEREKVTHDRIAEENRAIKEKLAGLHEVTGPNSLLEKNMALEKQVKSLNAELSEAQRQYDTLKKQVAKSKDEGHQALLKAQAENKKRLINVATSIDQLQANNKNLQEKLAASETRLSIAENREKTLIAQKQEIEQQLTKVKTTLSNQKQELENIKKQTERLKKEKQALERTLEKINSKETPLVTEQAENSAKLKEQETRIKAQEEELKKKAAESQSLNDRLTTLCKEKITLEAKLKATEQTSKSLKAAEKAKAEENQRLKAENSKLKRQEESNQELESFTGYVLAQKDWQEVQEKSEETIMILKEHEQLLAKLKAQEGELQTVKRLEGKRFLEQEEQLQSLRVQLAAKEEEIERSERRGTLAVYALEGFVGRSNKLRDEEQSNKAEGGQNGHDLALEQPQALKALQDEINRKEAVIIRSKCAIEMLREATNP